MTKQEWTHEVRRLMERMSLLSAFWCKSFDIEDLLAMDELSQLMSENLTDLGRAKLHIVGDCDEEQSERL